MRRCALLSCAPSFPLPVAESPVCVVLGKCTGLLLIVAPAPSVACPPGTYSVPHLATGELASSSVAGMCKKGTWLCFSFFSNNGAWMQISHSSTWSH